MPDETKPPTASELKAKSNAEASESYKAAVNGKFTNGKKNATVLKYTPSRLTGGNPRQCFLVNYGHPNCSFYVPCKEFMEEYKPITGDIPAVESAPNNLPE